MKLKAQQRTVLVFDSFDDAVGGCGCHTKARSRRCNGLNVACVDLDFVLPQQHAQVRPLGQHHRVGACAAFLAMDERAGHLAFDVGVDGASGVSIHQLHAVANPEDRFARSQEGGEHTFVGGQATRVRLGKIIRQRADQAVGDGRPAGDDEAVEPRRQGTDRRLVLEYRHDHRETAGAFDRLHVAVVQALFLRLERCRYADADLHAFLLNLR